MFTEEELGEIQNKSTEDMTPEEIATLSDRDKAIRGLIYDPSIYDAEWFNSQGWQHHWIQKILGWTVGRYGPFESSLDLGAGDGCYSHILAEMGTDAYAVEVSKDAVPVMGDLVHPIVHDLRGPLDLQRTFDLVICLEVAEHIPQENSDTLCDTIARHCGNLLLFTAAPVGQGGHGHCNCQPFEFWKSRLVSRGLVLLLDETKWIRHAWTNILRDELPWLTRNILVYRKGK